MRDSRSSIANCATASGPLWAGLLLLSVNVPLLAEVPASLPGVPDDIKESVRRRVDNGYTVGVVIGLINPQGRRYYSYGKTALPDGKGPDENTIFEIGSVTKVFTSLLLADMAEQNEVALEDPIKKYLPDGVGAPARKGQSIQLVHLATHTSALPRLPGNMEFATLDNPYADYAARQMYEFLSSYKLRRDVGEKYEYSNYGMGLLGHLLARHGGQTYEQLLRQRITDKLAMTDTSITLTPEMQKRLAKGHRGQKEVPGWDFVALAGAGALRSTAHDMLTFLAVNMGLSDSPLGPALRRAHKARCQANGGGLKIGLGWHILIQGGRQLHWHNGGTGGYSSFVAFDKGARTGVVVLTNSLHSVDDIGLRFFLPKFPLRDHATPVQGSKVVSVGLSPGEKLPAGEDIVERSIERMGGRQKLAKIQNRLIKATAQVKMFGSDITGSMVAYQARPHKSYIKTQLPGLYTVEQGSNGDVVWEINSMTGTRVVTGRERALMLLASSFDMTNYKELYEKIECVGKAALDGRMCYKVVFTPKLDCDPVTQYFAVDSGMPLRRDYTVQMGQSKVSVRSKGSDFRKVDDIVYPHHTCEEAMGVVTHIRIRSIDHDAQIPPGRFDLPLTVREILDRKPGKQRHVGE